MSSKAVSHVSDGNQSFSNKLYEILCKQEGNVFFSPISAHAILSLVYQGAHGETAKSLGNALHLSDTMIAAEGYRNLMEKLNAVKDVTLHIANKVFVHNERTLKKDFDAIAKKHFQSETQNISFYPNNKAAAGQINSWVEKKTNNKIKDLIQPQDLDDLTRLVLVNAIYFKGDWLHKFEPRLTKKEKFYISETATVDCDMMHINKKFFYAEDDDLNAQILRLPYKNENLSLMIILPRSKTGIAEVEKKLMTKNLTQLNQNLYNADIILSLPKFKIETTMELKDPLTEMGCGVIFSDGAEFPGMLKEPESLKVSKIIQKAFIEVNEEGAEAAAATGVQMMLLCLSPEFVFTADHPFLFVLSYNQVADTTAIPLFVGKVTKL